MTINIKNILINVDSTFDIVFNRLKQFEISDVSTDNKIIINDNLIDISVLDYKLKIKEKINTTDIYPILNNLIAYLINDENNLYIHSVVISKNNKGILVLGDFKVGKSALAIEAQNYGYEVNSADQTWIKTNEMVLGSSFNKDKNGISFLDKKNVNKKVKLERIIILKGISTNGELSIQKIENRDYYVKNIFRYSNWHYDMPLLTKYIKLKDTGEKILKFINKLNIEAYFICGDERKIMEAICDRKEGIKQD
ncbi:MAG: hypothetical protein II119_01905 [Bacilli bacterium]|nr:hypothetical protein [Bacilli bacterium]MBQ6283126.1 hypothetical protein [Bacilli bacterium]